MRVFYHSGRVVICLCHSPSPATDISLPLWQHHVLVSCILYRFDVQYLTNVGEVYAAYTLEEWNGWQWYYEGEVLLWLFQNCSPRNTYSAVRRYTLVSYVYCILSYFVCYYSPQIVPLARGNGPKKEERDKQPLSFEKQSSKRFIELLRASCFYSGVNPGIVILLRKTCEVGGPTNFLPKTKCMSDVMIV